MNFSMLILKFYLRNMVATICTIMIKRDERIYVILQLIIIIYFLYNFLYKEIGNYLLNAFIRIYLNYTMLAAEQLNQQP